MAGGSYNAKSADVWSCGVMLFVMLFGDYPFADIREVSQYSSFLSALKVLLILVRMSELESDSLRCTCMVHQGRPYAFESDLLLVEPLAHYNQDSVMLNSCLNQWIVLRWRWRAQELALLFLAQVMLGKVQFPEKPVTSEAVKELILRMTDRNTVTRIKLEDICSHTWVAQVIIILLLA